MALFTQQRDISFFRHVNRELMSRIISQQVLYYKLALEKTAVNSYGESKGKFYYDPLMLTCLIDRPDSTTEDAEYGATTITDRIYRFLKDDLIQLNLVPERGDIIAFHESYYEVDHVLENQFIGGKVPEYSLQSDLDKFGSSWSMMCYSHLTSITKLNIIKAR
jgi:hypothetical protein